MHPEGQATCSWRHIAVAVDSCAEAQWALIEAIAAARRQRARLTIIAVAPNPWPCAGMGGIALAPLTADPIGAASDLVRRLAATVPSDLPCTTYARCGRSAGEILEILRTERADVLFIASPHGVLGGLGRRWLLRRLVRDARADVIAVGGDSRSLSDPPALACRTRAVVATRRSPVDPGRLRAWRVRTPNHRSVDAASNVDDTAIDR
jgi:nucleotide-binding universal stress UspA family protein